MKMTDIVLASASPRRREILTTLGVRFRVVVSGAKEDASITPDTLIIACDTVVVYNGVVIGKPPDEPHAILTLGMLSDSCHSVLSGLSVYYHGRTAGTVARTEVKFRELSEAEILAYVESGEPMGKAGSYAIQQKGASFAERIEGDFYNVVGLPVAALLALLRSEFGITSLDIMNF